MRKVRFLATAARVALAIPAVSCALASAAFAAGAHSQSRLHVRAARPIPPLIRPALPHTLPSSASAYTIIDHGVPSFAISAAPVAFNNTGQIIGRGFALSTGAPDCVLYNGLGTFLDVSRYGPTYDCKPLSLSAANSSGVVTFVGSAQTPYSAGSRAFYGTANRDAGSIQVLGSYASSTLFGVNSSGEVTGVGYYEPYGTFEQFAYDTTVALAGSGTDPGAVDQCAGHPVGGFGCAAPVATAPCGFGGCSINDAGTLLVRDTDYGLYATLDVYNELVDTTVALYGTDLVLMNNPGTLAYDLYSSSTSAQTIVGSTTVPALTGNSCSEYFPVSLNNAGAVLGYTAQCAVANDAVYWTWDPVNGTQNLNALIPANNFVSIAPLGLNDAGQILISATDARGAIHWALLEPPASSSAKTKREVRS